jgi:hypothetical protein
VTDNLTDTERSGHHTLQSLHVTGGFLSGLRLDFADGLNCFIGGRGAGKTTALEFLRYGLGLMPDPRTSPQRLRTIDALVKANLGSGRISIDLRTKTGMRYTAGRGAAESVQVLNAAGSAVPVSLDRDQIFGADVFSQNEIEEIAASPAAQLDLLDRFEESESVIISRALEELHRELDQSSADLARIDEDLDDLLAKASELPAIEERLKGLVAVGGPDAERINASHEARGARAREERVPSLLITALNRAAHEVTLIESEFRGQAEAHLGQTVLRGANGELFGEVASELSSFGRVLAESVRSVVSAARETEARLTRIQAVLAERHAMQEAEYRALISESEEQGGRAAERSALQIAHAAAQAAANAHEAKTKQRESQLKTRAELLKRLSELRDQRFALRKRVAESLTQRFSSIRVTVAQAADIDRYCDLIADALKGAGMKQGMVADRLSQAFLPTELSRIIARNDHGSLMQRASLEEDRARKILDALRASGKSYALETVDLGDRPCIELLDGEQYKESPNLSTGQRCTTILPILLVQSERPLLIDQPEDNLDNAFVFETIVTALRAVKGTRQVIFVTHNPNIPVLGEAERVFVFASDGRRAALRQVGTVDDCKEQIEKILEGGREAFLQRKVRYGH